MSKVPLCLFQKWTGSMEPFEPVLTTTLTDQTKNVGGAKCCILGKMPKVGGAIASPAPPVPPSLD